MSHCLHLIFSLKYPFSHSLACLRGKTGIIWWFHCILDSLSSDIYLALVCFQFKNTSFLDKNSHTFLIFNFWKIFLLFQILWIVGLLHYKIIYTRFKTPLSDVANTVSLIPMLLFDCTQWTADCQSWSSFSLY